MARTGGYKKEVDMTLVKNLLRSKNITQNDENALRTIRKTLQQTVMKICE